MAGTLMRQSIHAGERQIVALPPAPALAALPAPFPVARNGAHSLKRQARSLRSPVLAAAAAVAERPTVSFAQQTPEAIAKENVATQKPTVRAVGTPGSCTDGDCRHMSLPRVNLPRISPSARPA